MACECERSADPNLGQALHLMNGDLVNRKLSQPDGRLGQAAASDPKLTDETLVRTLYIVTFNRPADRRRGRRRPAPDRRGPEPRHRGPGPLLGPAELQGILVQPLIERFEPADCRRCGTRRSMGRNSTLIDLDDHLAASIAARSWPLTRPQPRRGDEPPTYERDIRPLFAKRCTVCHNRKKLDDPDVSGGLALDSSRRRWRGPRSTR